MKSAIVTGSAGFIGSHLTERLLKDGFKVTGIDCFTDLGITEGYFFGFYITSLVY